MGFTDSLLSEGKLKSLEDSTETEEGINRTLHVTQGRFSKTAIESIFGKKELPIVSARLIVEGAHQIGGHKEFKSTTHFQFFLLINVYTST